MRALAGLSFIALTIFLVLAITYTLRKSRRKKFAWRATGISLVLFVVFASLSPKKKEQLKPPREQEKIVRPSEIAARQPQEIESKEETGTSIEYQIVRDNDITIKALEKPLSAYTSSELMKLPLNIRKEYKILVPFDISQQDLKATFLQLIGDETSKNPHIDEIVVFAYDREEYIDGPYTHGKIEWCPQGVWGGVTPRIASTNDRSSYKHNLFIRDKVGRIDLSTRPTEKEFKIYDTYEKILMEERPVSDEEIINKVAQQFSINPKEFSKIYSKVSTYILQ